jgi:dihydropteroate synthase
MGILNVTPDSFSDGGRHFDRDGAIAAGVAMHEAGAAIVDIGGESTRPGAAPLGPDEEQARILPVIRALASRGIAMSADTRHATTMAAALEAGARIINDVTALAHDPGARAAVSAYRAPVVLMHMRGTPETMDDHASYDDVACDVATELACRVAAAEAAGIVTEAIAVDPGFGFAKTNDGNIALLSRLALLHCLGRPLLVGVSRKRMIGALTGEPDAARRDHGSIAAALRAASLGAQILRVHDVWGTAQALRAWRGLHGH